MRRSPEGAPSRGLNVVLIARRIELAQQIADDIAAMTGVQTRALRADLADRDDLDRILADLADVDVGLLIYNAAFSVVGPFWNFDIDTHLKEIDVNVRGPLVLAHGFGERFRARGRGGIVLLSSMGALQGMVRVANYCATKAYNLVLAEGLWAELRDDGVDVLVSCAGATRTPNYLASEPDDSNVPVQEPVQVADRDAERAWKNADGVPRSRAACHALCVPPPDGTPYRRAADGLCEQPNL